MTPTTPALNHETLGAIERQSTAHAQSAQSPDSLLLEPALDTKQFGAAGEAYARQWLEQRGWHHLDHNWHSRYGEIDLVMLDDTAQIVIVEVKSRRSTRFGSPETAITPHKRVALRRAAVQWLHAQHRLPYHLGLRFDVIGILVQDGSIHVHLTAGAF